ncbi:MAG: DUF3596 domain-containing protein [Oceanococcaceae bacterium]
MASISERGGLLYFDFRVSGERCREYTKLKDTPANRKKMQKVLDRIETAMLEGTLRYEQFFPQSRKAKKFATVLEPMPQSALAAATANVANDDSLPTFDEVARRWQEQKAPEWRRTYRNSVQCILAMHLLPAFEALPVDQVDRNAVLNFRKALTERRPRTDKEGEGPRLRPATVNRIMGILRMILEEASLTYGITNPCRAIKRLKNPRTDIEPFTLEEVRALITAVRPDYRPYLTLRFFTGLRTGEVHGLAWKHIDFTRSQILVRQTYTQGAMDSTKTDSSRREVSMSAPVREALMAMRPDGFDAEPQAFADRLVFATKNGKPIENRNFIYRVWNPLLRRVGLRERRPYQMRHTAATLWLAAGEAPEWIARQLGHSTTEMLFRVYSRYVPNLTRQDGSAFDNLLTAAMNDGVRAEKSHAA